MEFLEMLKIKPSVASDSVVLGLSSNGVFLLMVQRGKEPHIGSWALPGGFMENNETLEDTSSRELKEETGLGGINMVQIGAFSRLGRDPRGTVISVAYLGIADADKFVPVGADDAADAKWVSLSELPEFLFDHQEMFDGAIKIVREKINDDEWLRKIVPEKIDIDTARDLLKKYI